LSTSSTKDKGRVGHVSPPEKNDRARFEEKARDFFLDKKLYVVWAEGPEKGSRAIGFRSLAE